MLLRRILTGRNHTASISTWGTSGPGKPNGCAASLRRDGSEALGSVSRYPAEQPDFLSGLPRFRHVAIGLGVLNRVHSACMAKHVPVREFRSRLSELLNDVADRRDHILVTRNGKPAAALVPIDEYQALEETAEILSDPDAIAAIEAGLVDVSRGDTVTLDALRAELAERRRAL